MEFALKIIRAKFLFKVACVCGCEGYVIGRHVIHGEFIDLSDAFT